MNVAQDKTIILVRSKDLLDHRSLSSRDQKNLDDTAFPHLHIGTEEDEGAAIYTYIVRWLGHHGNRLYGFMGLQS